MANTSLPALTSRRLNIIFETVYHPYDNLFKTPEGPEWGELEFEYVSYQRFCASYQGSEVDVSTFRVLRVVKQLQWSIYHHRQGDFQGLFGPISGVIQLERGSEGTSLWLCLMLALKELYGMSVDELVQVMRKVDTRRCR